MGLAQDLKRLPSTESESGKAYGAIKSSKLPATTSKNASVSKAKKRKDGHHPGKVVPGVVDVYLMASAK